MSEMKTAEQHNLEHGAQPYHKLTADRSPISDLERLELEELTQTLLDDGYFSSDPELEELLRDKLKA